jgi:hypothetical protein
MSPSLSIWHRGLSEPQASCSYFPGTRMLVSWSMLIIVISHGSRSMTVIHRDACLTYSFDIVPREDLMVTFDKAYFLSRHKQISSSDLPPHDLALFFVVLATGTYYNLELASDDSSIDDYLKASKLCLAKGNFLESNTIPALQTLVLNLPLVQRIC